MDTWLVARGNKPQACGKPFIHCKCPYHRLSISLTAILWTAIGFALIKLAAFMILSGRIAGEEIGSLLTGFLGTLLFFFGLRSFLGLVGRPRRPGKKAAYLHLPSAAGKRNPPFPRPCHQLAADSGCALLLWHRGGSRAGLRGFRAACPRLHLSLPGRPFRHTGTTLRRRFFRYVWQPV